MEYLTYLSDLGFSYKPQRGRVRWVYDDIIGSYDFGLYETPRKPINRTADYRWGVKTLAKKEKEVVEFSRLGSLDNDGYFVSSRFKDLVEAENIQGVEFIPVELRMDAVEPVKTLDGYWFMNVYETLDIIDMKKSELTIQYFSVDPSRIFSIDEWKNLVLTVDHIENDLFRLPGMKRKLFISEKFANILKENKIRNINPRSKLLIGGRSPLLVDEETHYFGS